MDTMHHKPARRIDAGRNQLAAGVTSDDCFMSTTVRYCELTRTGPDDTPRASDASCDRVGADNRKAPAGSNGYRDVKIASVEPGPPAVALTCTEAAMSDSSAQP